MLNWYFKSEVYNHLNLKLAEIWTVGGPDDTKPWCLWNWRNWADKSWPNNDCSQSSRNQCSDTLTAAGGIQKASVDGGISTWTRETYTCMAKLKTELQETYRIYSPRPPTVECLIKQINLPDPPLCSSPLSSGSLKVLWKTSRPDAGITTPHWTWGGQWTILHEGTPSARGLKDQVSKSTSCCLQTEISI